MRPSHNDAELRTPTAELFARLIEAVQAEHDLSDDEAMGFVCESCKAGGLPNLEEERELVEQLLEAARDQPDIDFLA